MLNNQPGSQSFNTYAEQSPVCLIKDHKGPCIHNHCLLAYKKPQFFGIRISDFYNQEQFSEFDVIHSAYGPPQIIPHNSNPGSGNDFEGFRQSMNAIIHLAGLWPDSKTVKRSDVEFNWIEHNESYPVTNYETFNVEWLDRKNVSEYACYIGSLDGLSFKQVDVNAVFERPENTGTIYLCKKGGRNND